MVIEFWTTVFIVAWVAACYEVLKIWQLHVGWVGATQSWNHQQVTCGNFTVDMNVAFFFPLTRLIFVLLKVALTSDNRLAWQYLAANFHANCQLGVFVSSFFHRASALNLAWGAKDAAAVAAVLLALPSCSSRRLPRNGFIKLRRGCPATMSVWGLMWNTWNMKSLLSP